MDLDPTWVPVLSAFGGGFVVWAGGIINDWITYRRDEKRRVREEKQKWVESRRNAYYKFIDVFSTYVTNPDPHDYFQSAFEAAMYGDVIIPTPFKLKQCSFISDINSLDLLLAALIFMKSDYVPGNDKTHDTLKEELEDLRSKALTPFLNEFMNIIRQKEDEAKIWWHPWKKRDASQSPRDKVLLALFISGGMKKNHLRRYTKLKLSELEPVLKELKLEGHIRISGDMVSLDPAHASRQNS